ncbi:MAG TPA: replication-associated recombination protein A [Fimbriimonadaceae bacterium]|nr:replication-associated recombination protein A [Fimbriimonadaceae bacterium]
MRPRSFEEFVGQEHLTAPGAAFRTAAEAGKLGSVIFWGPPGVGKTTLAEIVARSANARFHSISAVSAGVADLRRIISEARNSLRNGTRSVLFIDEIHRFNKGQQDAILPVVEDGTVTLIGATTENPSFEVNSALLSRSRVYVLNSLTDEQIMHVVRSALENKENGLAGRFTLEEHAAAALVGLANGDARAALNMLELSSSVAEAAGQTEIDLEVIRGVVQRRSVLYDKTGEMHYDIISALHKSIRGSDPDASLYWLARMLAGGEQPLFIARRLVRAAMEDIGLANPQALAVAIAAKDAYEFLGSPEGELALAECVLFLAAAPKSNRVYKAFGAARAEVEETRNDPVPMHLRNAPTRLMQELGYGKGYVYAHDFEGAVVAQQNLPDSLAGRKFYEPSDRGYEAEIAKRLAAWSEAMNANREAD